MLRDGRPLAVTVVVSAAIVVALYGLSVATSGRGETVGPDPRSRTEIVDAHGVAEVLR